MWVAFTSAEFTAWHDAECAARGIPHPGRRQSDGTVQVDNEWTTSWVQPAYRVTLNKKTYEVCQLDTRPATGIVLDSLTVNRDGSITVVYGGKSYTATPSTLTAAKPKPSSIVIDGQTYTRTK